MTNLMQVTETAVVSMTSLEIAELTGKEHRNVLADIRNMLEELQLSTAEFSAVYKDQQLIDRPCFNLPKRETLILVSGYSTTLRAAIVDRLIELETQVQNQQLEILNLRRSQLLHDYSDSIGQIAQAWTQITQAKQDLSQTHKNLKAFVDDQVNRLREHSIEVRCEGHDETADFLIELSKKIKRESSAVKVDSSNSIKEWLSNSEKLLNHYLSEKLKAN